MGLFGDGCRFCGLALGIIVLVAVFWNRFGARAMWIALAVVGGIIVGVAAVHFFIVKAFWDNWK